MKASVIVEPNYDKLLYPITSVPSGWMALYITEYNYVGKVAAKARRAAKRQRDYWRFPCMGCAHWRHYLEFMRAVVGGTRPILEQQGYCFRCAPPLAVDVRGGPRTGERKLKDGTIEVYPDWFLNLGFGRWVDGDAEPLWFSAQRDDPQGRAQMDMVYSDERELRKANPAFEYDASIYPESPRAGARVEEPLEVRLQPYPERKLQAEYIEQEHAALISPPVIVGGRQVRD